MFSKKININPLLYIPFVLVLTWTPWLLAVSTGRGIENFAVKVLLLAGLLVPALVALTFILLSEDAEYHWDYWRRVFDPTLITAGAVSGYFLLPPIVTLAAILISYLLGESLGQLRPGSPGPGPYSFHSDFYILYFLYRPFSRGAGLERLLAGQA